MKYLKKYLGIIILLILCVMAFFAMTSTAQSTEPIPEDAQTLGRLIQKKSHEYSQKEAELKPLLSRVRELESAMSKLSGGAAGLDQTLCVEYGLKYVRGSGEEIGTFEKSDCPLQ